MKHMSLEEILLWQLNPNLNPVFPPALLMVLTSGKSDDCPHLQLPFLCTDPHRDNLEPWAAPRGDGGSFSVLSLTCELSL